MHFAKNGKCRWPIKTPPWFSFALWWSRCKWCPSRIQMAVRPVVCAVKSSHCSLDKCMFSVQICCICGMTHQIFLRLPKIAFVACNECNAAFIACNKCVVAYTAYIAYISCKKETLRLWLSRFLKTHQKREAGLKVCPKCFFTTTVNRFYFILLFCLSHKK